MKEDNFLPDFGESQHDPLGYNLSLAPTSQFENTQDLPNNGRPNNLNLNYSQLNRNKINEPLRLGMNHPMSTKMMKIGGLPLPGIKSGLFQTTRHQEVEQENSESIFRSDEHTDSEADNEEENIDYKSQIND